MLFLGLIALGLIMGGRLDRGAQVSGFTRVETNRFLLEYGEVLHTDQGQVATEWLDPRWEQMLSERMAAIEDFEADDPAGVAAVMAGLRELSFIEEIGEPRILWPDGLEVPLRLRRPVACIAWQDTYFSVAVDWSTGVPRGVILEGPWPSLPSVGARYLPVIDRLDDVPDSVWLEDEVQLDALAIADSMWQSLDDTDYESLGRILIDARTARLTAPEEPGTRIELEDHRVVLFGRSPAQDAPGELPINMKWKSIRSGLGELRAGKDWESLDVRWERPVMVLRGTVEED
ncbi:MAG: hypothetical protein ACJAZ8_002680 [Planctomycetota bacterium]